MFGVRAESVLESCLSRVLERPRFEREAWGRAWRVAVARLTRKQSELIDNQSVYRTWNVKTYHSRSRRYCSTQRARVHRGQRHVAEPCSFEAECGERGVRRGDVAARDWLTAHDLHTPNPRPPPSLPPARVTRIPPVLPLFLSRKIRTIPRRAMATRLHVLPDHLAVEERPGRGRCLILKRPAAAGEVLLAESPVCWWVDADRRDQICTRCLGLLPSELDDALCISYSASCRMRYC